MPSSPATRRRRPPSLRDVGRFLAGVSINTVSNVVNDSSHVKDSTREKVRREAILQVGHRPRSRRSSCAPGRAA